MASKKIDSESMTEEDIKRIREQRNQIRKNRAERIKQIMAENEKIIGKKQMENNKKEAKAIAWDLEEEAIREMNETEVEKRREKMQKQSAKYWQNHRDALRARDAEVLKTLSKEDAIKFKKARRLSESMPKIEQFMQLSVDQLDELYEQRRVVERVKEARRRKKNKRKKQQEQQKTM